MSISVMARLIASQARRRRPTFWSSGSTLSRGSWVASGKAHDLHEGRGRWYTVYHGGPQLGGRTRTDDRRRRTEDRPAKIKGRGGLPPRPLSVVCRLSSATRPAGPPHSRFCPSPA